MEEFDGVPLSAWTAAWDVLRQKNAEIEKISDSTVRRAARDIRETIEQTYKVRGVPKPIMSPERMAAVEHQMKIGFRGARPNNGPASILPAPSKATPDAAEAPPSPAPSVKPQFFKE